MLSASIRNAVDYQASALEVIVAVFAIAGGLYAGLKVIGIFVLWIRGANIRLFIADRVWPVGHTGERNIAIQIHFSLLNKGARLGVLQRIEVVLTSPRLTTHLLPWEIFLEPRADGVVPKSTVFPIPIDSRTFESLAIQCRGWFADMEAAFEWPRGIYALHIIGWINGRRKNLSPAAGYRFEVDNIAWALLSPHFNDPPEPIAHSVPVLNWTERRSLWHLLKWRIARVSRHLGRAGLMVGAIG